MRGLWPMKTNKVMFRSFLLLLLLGFLPLKALADGQERALLLLEKMCTAAKELNYQGVFAYQNGRKLQSIKIIHRNDENGESERLISLSGVAREVIRNNDEVTYILPEGSRKGVQHQPLGRGFPSDFLDNLHSAAAYYDMSLGRRGRIAGRHVKELIINPVDSFRYGYRLWVGEETHLLLQFELVNGQGEALETFAFSELQLDPVITDAQLQPETMGADIQQGSQQYGAMTEYKATGEKEIEEIISPWNIKWLPEGFELVVQKSRQNMLKRPAMEHRVYSDGLSAISVFFEKMRAQHGHLKGGSHMGAVNAFGTTMHGHFVTVVGEVPRQTVEQLGESIERTEK